LGQGSAFFFDFWGKCAYNAPDPLFGSIYLERKKQ